MMINLMYLVLTALLALNVSAEVMNAFFSLDKGMKQSREIVDNTNNQLMEGIKKQAEAYDKPENRKYKANAEQAQQIGKEFVDYIESIRQHVFELGGGPNKKNPEQPKDIRNKDITTRYFVLGGMKGEPAGPGKGFEIEQKVKETREKLLALADNDKGVEAALPLNLEPLPAGTDKKNWSDFKFRQMPIAAIFPILGKLQSDAKNSTTAVLNYCATKVGGVDIKFNTFEPVISAKKGYVISGEKYEADVFLSAYSSDANNISISVNGTGLPVKDGKAHYETGTSSIGSKKYAVAIRVTNPLTKEVTPYNKEFEYEVGQRSVAVALLKMNVFYIGVDNPIAVSAAGVNSNDVKVSGSGGGITLTRENGSNYNIRVTTPGECSIVVSAPGVSQTFTYKAKRIPDPVALLGAKHNSKAMPNGEFKAQGGIAAVLQNFDFDAKCEIVGFKVGYLKKRQDPVEKNNSGARWGSDVADLVNKAAPGDTYFFDEIKARCPGDAAARELNALVFKIR